MTKRMRLSWRKMIQGRLGKATYRTFFRIDGGEYRPVVTPNPYVADPFLFVRDGVAYLFYETLKAKKGVLGCFRRENGAWKDLGVVLEEPWHLSYPQVFEEDGKVFMIPESCDFRGGFSRGAVRLYEPADFPFGWQETAKLIEEPFSDSTLYRRDGRYYLSCDREHPGESAELWQSLSLTGPWTRHPQSANHSQSKRLRRCGGAFQERDGRLFRIAQDCNGAYGKRLFKVPVEQLTPTEYREGPAELFHTGMRHTYNCAQTPEGFMEVVDELSYRYEFDVHTVLKALAIPFQLMFRFNRRAADGHSGWLFQLFGIQFIHGHPVGRPAFVQIRIK